MNHVSTGIYECNKCRCVSSTLCGFCSLPRLLIFQALRAIGGKEDKEAIATVPRSSPRGPSVRGKTDSLSDQMLTDGEAIRPGQVCHQGFRREKNEVNYWFKPKRVSNVQLRKDSCPFQVRWSFRNFLFKVNLKLYTCFKKRYHFDEFYFTGLDFF